MSLVSSKKFTVLKIRGSVYFSVATWTYRNCFHGNLGPVSHNDQESGWSWVLQTTSTHFPVQRSRLRWREGGKITSLEVQFWFQNDSAPWLSRTRAKTVPCRSAEAQAKSRAALRSEPGWQTHRRTSRKTSLEIPGRKYSKHRLVTSAHGTVQHSIGF